MDETIRAFIAIELDPQAHNELSSLQETLKNSGADVKWVEPRNIHLTLRFLGGIKPVVSEEVKRIMTETAAHFKAFDLTIKDIGGFPDIDSPRVIWVGVDSGAGEATRIAKEIETKLESIGIPKEERKFHPHLTLGRARSRKNGDKLHELIGRTKFKGNSKIKADHLTLFESRPAPQGSIYTPLFKASMAIS